jgi:signal transduction histidine kinase
LGARPDRPVDLPLVAAGETVGRLRLGPRPGEATLGGRDLRLLHDLARQLAVAARAVRAADRAQRLSEDLQRSREQLVVAREEERRRLRRDLHDGLGPTLAGLTMRAEAALELGGGPEAARLLEEIVADTQTAIADVRRLVDGLRPPALDTMGLAGALRAHVTGWPAGSGPRVTFDAPDPLPPLGAATEVAAYRIAVEALANARRHAGARCVDVRLAVAGERLRVTVADDGAGLGATTVADDGAGAVDDRATTGAGVGLHSLRERAAELGGVCRITARPDGGTLVAASLPLKGDR